MSDDVIESRKLHEGILTALGRVPECEQASEAAAAEPASQSPVAAASYEQISSYLTRIEQAATLLQQKTNRARELEEVVYSLQDRQAEQEASFEEVTRRNAELEKDLAAERNRATRAQAILAQTAKRMQEMERALADANARADALISAIDRAFQDVVDPSQDYAAIAAA